MPARAFTRRGSGNMVAQDWHAFSRVHLWGNNGALSDDGGAGPASWPRVRNLETSKTILVVDDEEVVRHYVKLTLRKEGFDLLDAADGLDAAWDPVA